MVLGIKLCSSSLARQVLYQLGHLFNSRSTHTFPESEISLSMPHVSTEYFILKHELQCISAHQFFQIYPLTAKMEYTVVVVVELMCLLQAFAVRIFLTATDHKTYSEKRKQTHTSDLNTQTLGPAEHSCESTTQGHQRGSFCPVSKLTALPVITSVGSQVLNVNLNF